MSREELLTAIKFLNDLACDMCDRHLAKHDSCIGCYCYLDLDDDDDFHCCLDRSLVAANVLLVEHDMADRKNGG